MNGRRDWPGAPEADFLAESFDGGVRERCPRQEPDRYSFFSRGSAHRFAIARGAGLSYAAASFGREVLSVDMSAFDRVLGFCEKSGVLEVEAGARLGALYEFLIPRGFYLPIQPGHAAISIGGCIAANVHGKNHARHGTFERQVVSLRLFHPEHGIVELSDTVHRDIFQATCGGYGTTGIIVSARLRCARTPGNSLEVSTERIADFGEAVAALRSLTTGADFAYSWHDLAQRKPGAGSGYVSSGRFVTLPSPFDAPSAVPALQPDPGKRLPFCALNRWTMRPINGIHAARAEGKRFQSLYRTLFPIHGSERYFAAFGRRGFHEVQAVIPHERFDEYAARATAAIAHHAVTITLASTKIFDSDAPRLLRFDGTGVCVALNFPRNARAPGLLNTLDRLIVETGGRPNVIKDSRLPRYVAEATYPQLDRLRATLKAWDPRRLFRSELSVRLGL